MFLFVFEVLPAAVVQRLRCIRLIRYPCICLAVCCLGKKSLAILYIYYLIANFTPTVPNGGDVLVMNQTFHKKMASGVLQKQPRSCLAP